MGNACTAHPPPEPRTDFVKHIPVNVHRKKCVHSCCFLAPMPSSHTHYVWSSYTRCAYVHSSFLQTYLYTLTYSEKWQKRYTQLKHGNLHCGSMSSCIIQASHEWMDNSLASRYNGGRAEAWDPQPHCRHKAYMLYCFKHHSPLVPSLSYYDRERFSPLFTILLLTPIL